MQSAAHPYAAWNSLTGPAALGNTLGPQPHKPPWLFLCHDTKIYQLSISPETPFAAANMSEFRSYARGYDDGDDGDGDGDDVRNGQTTQPTGDLFDYGNPSANQFLYWVYLEESTLSTGQFDFSRNELDPISTKLENSEPILRPDQVVHGDRKEVRARMLRNQKVNREQSEEIARELRQTRPHLGGGVSSSYRRVLMKATQSSGESQDEGRAETKHMAIRSLNSSSVYSSWEQIASEIRMFSIPEIRKHAHLVQILKVFQPPLIHVIPHLVYEYSKHGNLSSYLENGELLGYDPLHICRDVGEGLSALHRHGIMHNDVK
jgi:serine/threonine protein kinase